MGGGGAGRADKGTSGRKGDEPASCVGGVAAGLRMGRLQRTRILVEGDPGLSARLCAQALRRHTVVTLAAPHEMLVVLKVRESARGGLFYLGEALATECRVRLGELPGIGLLLGSERQRAFALAVVDAVMSAPAPLPEESGWVALLQAEEARLAAARRIGQERIGRTRVEFSSMAREATSDV